MSTKYNLAITKPASKSGYHDSVSPAADAGRPRLSASERRASIVAAAIEVFSEVGYHRGTMSEVARRVGVTEPVIFQNFGSKAAVFAAVIEVAAERTSAAMEEGVAANGSVAAWLRHFLAPEHVKRIHARGTVGVLFADAMSLTADPVIADAARRAHGLIAGTLISVLANGKRDGDLRRDLEPETAAWWLLSLLASQGFRHAATPAPDGARIEAQLGEMTYMTLTGG